jgi:chorismate synthase
MVRFLTAGESHGRALVVILEGIPAGLRIDLESVTRDLRRRQGGYGRGRRMAIESDRADIISGVRGSETIGGPIAMLIENRDWVNWQQTMFTGPAPEPDAKGAKRAPVTKPRPGHADLAGIAKYGRADIRDILERASARETAARVGCWPRPAFASPAMCSRSAACESRTRRPYPSTRRQLSPMIRRCAA